MGVRTATPADVPALVELWQQLREEGPRRRAAEPAEAAAGRIALVVQSEVARVLVAELDGEIVGMAQVSRTPPGLLSESTSITLAAMHVSDRHRRRGVGKALLTAAVAYAEEQGVEDVVVSVYPQHREANRFYARLGFAPVVVRRVASVASLRRRLGSPEGRAALLRREIHVPRRATLPGRRRRLAPARTADRPTE
ncbi:MAG TPA: GNAT family N-acetyltransferase [Frankiaceae bacterium]|nr:GNAT family N-acetyltransferase [Frankiaceae bacterium]